MDKELPVIELLNCKIHAISMNETVNYINSCIRNNIKIHHVAVRIRKIEEIAVE